MFKHIILFSLLIVLCVAGKVPVADDDECYPLWYNQCKSNSECCSDYCDNNDNQWLHGVCKPTTVDPTSCQENWYNHCKKDWDCCSGYCNKGPSNSWKEGVCKTNERQHEHEE